MSKKKEPFIKKNLRPKPDIEPGKKIGDLTVGELSSILGFEESSVSGKNAEGLIGGFVKRIIDKSWKDYKDNKDLIYEGPLILQDMKGRKKNKHENLPILLEDVIKKISGLEKEIKKLKDGKK